MEISTRRIGRRKNGTYSCIEVTIKSSGSTIEEDVVDLNGKVDEDLIESLRDLVEELEEQNKLPSLDQLEQ